ncbi:hypothetical protein BGZ58_004862, partial [Dissophora ornata]
LRSKPDLAAPGGNILSTYPLAEGGYAVLSGTSMATPYIAGSHALYMQAKKAKAHGQDVRKVLKNTATISSNAGSKTKASAAKQGAGLVNVLSAILTTSSISPDHIDLLDSTHFQKTVKIQIKNHGKHSETYTLSHVPADSLTSYTGNNTFPMPTPIIDSDYATVSFSASKVKIAAGKTAKITLTFKEPKKGMSSEFPLYSGFVIATPSSKGSIAVHVPYTGVKGDIAKVPIFDTDSGLPALFLVDKNDNLLEVPKGDFTFDLVNNFPAVITRLGSHTPDMTIRVYDNSNKFVGYVKSTNHGAGFGFQGRDSNLDDNGNFNYNAWVWDGQVYPTEDLNATTTQLPAGTYSIAVVAQRKLSKGSYPKDFEIVQIGSAKIAGPQKTQL